MRQAAVQDPIREQEIEDELEAKPEDFLACNVCGAALSTDEKIINARFVNEAMAAGSDITIFPVCIKCNFDNLLVNSRLVREKKYGAILNEDKPSFFPTNKKLYDENLHQNSEEFKQLGTLHQENRTAAYYPPEQPQPTANANPNPIKMERGILKEPTPFALNVVEDGPNSLLDKADASRKKSTSIAESGRAIVLSDSSRANQLKHMIGDRMRDENLRANEINKELNAMKSAKLAKNPENEWKSDLLFPSTTNQEYINQE